MCMCALVLRLPRKALPLDPKAIATKCVGRWLTIE
uniref:Uncharacterized protein n=1 Tax=Anguilla anguilla TaxID=7936 RepID=A0A0E9P7M6_ANGAN